MHNIKNIILLLACIGLISCITIQLPKSSKQKIASLELRAKEIDSLTNVSARKT